MKKVLFSIMVALTMSGCMTISATPQGKYSEWWMTDENQHLVTQSSQSGTVVIGGTATFGSLYQHPQHHGGHHGGRRWK